ncbi:lysine-rich coiled-coil protein 1 [Pelobates fuscus]|uniref:lysine-rich coiled-coil protein 1 n=1 Tax=Pelobates fuscus TaxID=191477 RepID=UPI002FE4AA5A
MASEGAIIPQLVESITQSSPAASCSVPMAGGDISSNVQTELVLDEKTKKELFTDTFCRVCGAVLQFESHRISHYEGKKHAQKVRLYIQNMDLEETPSKNQNLDQPDSQVDGNSSIDKNKFCSLCNMVFSSKVVAQSHYVGKIHAKRLRQLTGESFEWMPQTDQANSAMSPNTPQADTESSQLEASTEQHSLPDNEIDLNDPNKYCKLCCASFNKSMVAQQHYNGKKHARNEARRRMMERMEKAGVESTVNDGNYVCPICSITLTSIEMYQSHMQGNKHQIKENIVANLMKTSNKSYDSFQDELADYIKVQKARGLEPKTQFRQEKDQYDSGDEEELEDRPPLRHTNSKMSVPYKYIDHHSIPYAPFNSSYPDDQRKAAWKARWEASQSQNLNKAAYFKMQNTRHNIHASSSQGSSDDYKGSSSDDSDSSHRRDKRHKRKHHKESKHRTGTKIKQEEEAPEKKKRRLEDEYSGKEEEKQECRKEEVEITVDKSKQKKEKKKKEEQSDRDSKKHKKVKKEGDQRTEEEILWDESILGF